VLTLLLVCVCLSGLLGSTAAQAQSCWYDDVSYVNFDTLSHSANTDATGSISVTCQAASNPHYSFTLCLMVPAFPTVNPRQLTNYNSNDNDSTVDFNLYSDPARTQIIGPPPGGGGYPLYMQSFTVPAGQQATMTFNVYGRVPPVPTSKPSDTFVADMNGLEVRYNYHQGNSAPSDCLGGGNAPISYYINVSGTVPSGCDINIAGASDLDFGEAGGLNTDIDGESSIVLNCPANTTWRLGLSDGSHGAAGQRRMAGPSGNFVEYELYRDSGRTQRWGDDLAGGTDVVSGSGVGQTSPTVIPVYGRVPSQPVGAAGSYSDTVTVTLEY
jgi:spore coat protein U-like protein